VIAGEVVLIHVHEGTIISSWSFTTTKAKEAFEAAHRTRDVWDANDKWTGERIECYLPDGTFDDPDSDTWIEVEGAMIEYVDGEKPQRVCGCGDPLSHGRGSDILHVEVK
jgi:hypothetical protein